MSFWPLVVMFEQKSECCVISLDLAKALKLGQCLKVICLHKKGP